MTFSQIQDEIRAVADRCDDSKEQQVVRVILLGLLGTMVDQSHGALTKHVIKQVEGAYDLAMAASHDAGNRSMREGGRTAWAVRDWKVACEMFTQLWPLTNYKQNSKKEKHNERSSNFQRSVDTGQ